MGGTIGTRRKRPFAQRGVNYLREKQSTLRPRLMAPQAILRVASAVPSINGVDLKAILSFAQLSSSRFLGGPRRNKTYECQSHEVKRNWPRFAASPRKEHRSRKWSEAAA
jgi:hypothetical protein